MKKVSIILMVVGLVLIICGNVFYKHHANADDSGGSAQVTTLDGNWSVKIPAFVGGIVFVIGVLAFAIDYGERKTKREKDESPFPQTNRPG